jgi:hypothetical protein
MRQYLDTKYFIGSDGTVLNSKTGRRLKDQDNGKGYRKITLTINGKQIQTYVHILVALTYLPLQKDKKQVNHKDGNKLNNDVSNLEWVSNSENQIHAHKNGLKPNGNKLWNGKFSKEDIEKIKKLKADGILQYKIAEIMNTTKGTISQILTNKRYRYV